MDVMWYVPVLIFIARIGDVSLGTVRMIFVINGWRWRAATVGFVEVLIWAGAVGGLVAHITHPVVLLAYAGGYATGTLVGVTVENRLAMGTRVARLINGDMGLNLSAALREAGYRVTRVEGTGRSGPVEVAFAVVKRRSLPALLREVQRVAPHTVLTVERSDFVERLSAAPRPGLAALAGMRK